ncbi:hypothetical protein CYMTET_29995 [Cymbomonas tetramitiformis]|uniref:Uncharacterized protein n=1 Tax=Cymbomonas tetramitiformis TaxID=36881 RepID=A0AAE0FJV6_9CHLO|nr:hypothetical protein CYMTET_29995 [Cymbomonas tetramitiformis]
MGQTRPSTSSAIGFTSAATTSSGLGPTSSSSLGKAVTQLSEPEVSILTRMMIDTPRSCATCLTYKRKWT